VVTTKKKVIAGIESIYGLRVGLVGFLQEIMPKLIALNSILQMVM